MADIADVLMDGPPTHSPQQVDAQTVLRGQRVLVYDPDTESWVSDLRAVDDPYWVDEQTGTKWPAVPRGTTTYATTLDMLTRAVLHVSVVTEPDFYQWQRDKRRPEVREYKAYLVWVE